MDFFILELELKEDFEDDFFTEKVSVPGSVLGLHHDLVLEQRTFARLAMHYSNHLGIQGIVGVFGSTKTN